jgi:predicted MPP superfamily phosphohydrolase
MNNGKFKIVQFTDFHYSTAYPAAKETIKLIEEVLAAEKPDLVALTGDIVTMEPCFESWDDIYLSDHAPVIAKIEIE